MNVGIAVVVPTRNRPDEAKLALNALVEQSMRPDIFLCDNSISDEPLRAFCKVLPGITYLRPESELSMGANWEWSLREAMRLSSASHFSIHYDRKVSKPDSWTLLANAAARFPNTLLSFSIDHISHLPPPLRLWQGPWTGTMFRISLSGLAHSICRGHTADIAHALPILSNCVVPRLILERMIDHFGTVCNAVGPDSAFMSRLMALEPDYIHVDRTMGVIHASNRSNGLGYLRNTGGDFRDFLKMTDSTYLHAAPIPGLNLGQNMLYHEYEVVRRETLDVLPPLDLPAVLDDLSKGLIWIDDPDLLAQYVALLRRKGWTGTPPEPFSAYAPESARYQRRTVWRMRLCGYRPPTISGFAFPNDARALKWALRYTREPDGTPDHLAILDPVAVGPAEP